MIRYQHASGDKEFASTIGLELLIETARLWRSLGHHDGRGEFRIEGVTGPDEYSAIADNNIYTNLMAQRNLLAAANAASEFSKQAERFGVDTEEAASWRDAADAMFIPYDEHRKIHPQSENYLEHARWDFDAYGPERYPLLLHAPYFDLYRKQVVKQPDLVLAMFVRGDFFSDEDKDRNFDYYEKITVRDSSLSACTQAIIAAEVGHLALAYDYYGEAALMDLEDREQNTRDGVHIASLAGAWLGAVAGWGGMRDHDGKLTFAPRLPEAITARRLSHPLRGPLTSGRRDDQRDELRAARGRALRDQPRRRGADGQRRQEAGAEDRRDPEAPPDAGAARRQGAAAAHPGTALTVGLARPSSARLPS